HPGPPEPISRLGHTLREGHVDASQILTEQENRIDTLLSRAGFARVEERNPRHTGPVPTSRRPDRRNRGQRRYARRGVEGVAQPFERIPDLRGRPELARACGAV